MNIVLKVIAVLVGISIILGGAAVILPSIVENNAFTWSNPFTGNSPNPGEIQNPDDPTPTETPQGTGFWSIGEKREEVSPIPTEDIPKNLTFAGKNRYTVSAIMKDIELTNPEINQANFVFTVTDADTGEVIAKTGTVAPGQYAYVNVYDHFQQAGTYNVIIGISTTSFGGKKLNGVNAKAVITVL